jgi:hypothetical protein
MVFVEYLVNGISSLYYYRSGTRDRYFIETIKGELTELTNDDIEFEQNGRTYSRKSNRYIGQLKNSFNDAPELGAKIEHSQFTHESLTELTSEYHDYVCDGEECIIYEKPLPAVRVAAGPVIGTISSGLHFVNYPLYEEYEYLRSQDLFLGLQLSIKLPRINEKLSCLIQAEYYKSYIFGSKVENQTATYAMYRDLHIHLTTLQWLIGLQYMYPKGKIRPTLAVGPILTYSLHSEFKHIDESASDTFVLTRESFGDPLLDNTYGAFFNLGADWNIRGRQHVALNLRYHLSNEKIGTIVRKDGFALFLGYLF